MNEQHLQEAEGRIATGLDEAAAPAPELEAEAEQQAKPARPAGVPEKFWDGEAGCVRTDALLKSYLEIERKLGSMVALPTDDGDVEGRGRLYRALGVPAHADDYQIAVAKRAAGAEPRRSTSSFMLPASRRNRHSWSTI